MEQSELSAVLDSGLLIRLDLWQPGAKPAPVPTYPDEGLEPVGKSPLVQNLPLVIYWPGLLALRRALFATFPSKGSATHLSVSTHFWVPKLQPPTDNKVFSLGFLKRQRGARLCLTSS